MVTAAFYWGMGLVGEMSDREPGAAAPTPRYEAVLFFQHNNSVSFSLSFSFSLTVSFSACSYIYL